MDWRKLLVVLLVVGGLFWLIKNPGTAANAVHSVIDLAERAAGGISSFFSNVFAGF